MGRERSPACRRLARMNTTTTAAAADDVRDRARDLMDALDHLAAASPENADAAGAFSTSLHGVIAWADEVR